MKLEVLPVTFAAAGAKQFAMAGRYVEILDAGAAVDLLFYDDGGGQVGDARNVVSGVFVTAGFTSFSVVSSTAQTVTLLLTDGSGGSRRQPGNVRVIDSSVDKTLAGNQFLQYMNLSAAAGAGSIVTLNANNGAKKVVVKALSVMSAVAGMVCVGYGTGGGTSAGMIGPCNSKLIAGAQSQARVGTANTAGVLPTVGEITGAVQQVFMQVPANTLTAMPLTTPLVLTGTQLLFISGNALNRDVAAIFDFEEV